MVEQTSKSYKGAMLIGLILASAAIPVAFSGYSLAAFALGVVGIATFFTGNLLGWWYHG